MSHETRESGAGSAAPAPGRPGEQDAGAAPAGTAFGGGGERWQGRPGSSAGQETGAAAAGSPVTITVNRESYRVDRPDMTAREIKAVAGATRHHILIRVAGDSGEDDEPQADSDTIALADGMRFRTVNSATFGSQAPLQAPPLLLDHVGQLRLRGHKVEVTAGDAIYVVIKDYPIPGRIWSRSSSDLLIVAHDTYPNSPLDMFWLDPPISRRNGGAAPEGAGTETRNGREWQSFSWHVGGWNPARDNLVTYLDVVDDRLRRDR